MAVVSFHIPAPYYRAWGRFTEEKVSRGCDRRVVDWKVCKRNPSVHRFILTCPIEAEVVYQPPFLGLADQLLFRYGVHWRDIEAGK